VTVARTGDAGTELALFVQSQLSTAAATLAEWACVWVLSASGVYYVLAAIGGAVLGAVLDFSVKKWWVFATARTFAAAEGARYALVSGLSALWFGGAVFVLVDLLKLRMPVAVVAGSVLVGVFWNYPLHRFFVFSGSTASGGPA
jgi:putative flippase GtrA